MLGLPTRTDAMELSADYAQAATAARLSDRLQLCLMQVFSTVYPHNHVVEAYRDGGSIERFMRVPDTSIQNIHPPLVPRAVAMLLRPELVRDHYLAGVTVLRQVLEEARQHADILVLAGSGGSKPQPDLYQMLMAMLDDFEQVLERLCIAPISSISRIAAMADAADRTRSDGTFQLAKDALVCQPRSAVSMERDEAHAIYPLVRRHLALAKASDVWLSFDENSFFGRPDPASGYHTVSMTSAAMLDTKRRLHYAMLWHRVGLRHIINQVIVCRGSAVINGATYRPAMTWIGGRFDGCYMASYHSDQMVVDLLGRPVVCPDGTMLMPATWATEEVALVAAFVDRRDPEAIEVLLERYDLDSSSGHPSRDKQLAQLEYTCTASF